MIVRLCSALTLLAAFPAWAESTLPPAVASHESPIGAHFTTAAGQTLYVYDGDATPLRSNCNGTCAKAWPPVVAPADAKPVGDWAPFKRDGDVLQWAYRGKPVYTFATDPQPGATLGDGVQRVWHIAIALKPRPPGVSFRGTVLGRVAATPTGMTLYSRDGGDCTGACLHTWLPFAAPEAAMPQGDWTIALRADDGTRQWAWQGRPLYTYRNDPSAGSLDGDGVGKLWHAVVVQPAPPLPPWVTIAPSDYGPIFADSHGHTLYALNEPARVKAEATCDNACIAQNWVPAIATPDAVATGNWSLLPLPDGRKQWAYRAEAVYTYAHDQKPGQIYGDKFALGGGSLRDGWNVLPQATLKEEPL